MSSAAHPGTAIGRSLAGHACGVHTVLLDLAQFFLLSLFLLFVLSVCLSVWLRGWERKEERKEGRKGNDQLRTIHVYKSTDIRTCMYAELELEPNYIHTSTPPSVSRRYFQSGHPSIQGTAS